MNSPNHPPPSSPTGAAGPPVTISTAAAGPPHGGGAVAWTGTRLGQGPAAMIMVHGRNASAPSILELARVLDRPDFTFIAPGASGHTWYPHSFMAEREMNEPGLSSGLAVIGALVEGVIEAGVPREKIVLLGFSQGACLASEFAYRNPARYGGVVIYSGGLIGPEGTTWEGEGSMDSTPVFLGCSDIDAHIPESRVHETADAFERLGADVTRRLYPGMGHLVNRDEIEFTQALMDRILEG